MAVVTQSVALLIDEINASLSALVEEQEGPANLIEAARYALLSPGKRLRPILAVRACEAVGGDGKSAFPAGAAIEMIHAFSLIHDDLPAMDDDDTRRGRPTCHIKFGETLAILAGDALATWPYEILTKKVADSKCAGRLVAELAQGTAAMIAGQVYDTLGGFGESLTPIQRLALTHRNKTGALLRAACRMGAISGHADDSQLQSITVYGEAIGLMFQIVDDVLDVTQTSEHLGKRTHKDEEAGKLTYPSLVGLEESRRRIVELETQALAALEPFSDSAQALADLARQMAVRTK